MISWAIIILCALTVVGFVSMFGAVQRAVDGYEDSDGFHQGVPPWNQVPLAVVIPVESSQEVGAAFRSEDFHGVEHAAAAPQIGR